MNGSSAAAGAIQPPYGVIWEALLGGNVVPFLGAGASTSGRAAGQKWEGLTSPFLPTGAELSTYLAKSTEFPANEPSEREDLAKVCSYFVDMNGRKTLRKKLRTILSKEYDIGPVHRLLARIERPLVIVVSNYDVLMENALRDAGREFDVVVYPADMKEYANAVLWWSYKAEKPEIVAPNELNIDLSSRTVVYKMHGTIVQREDSLDNFVITEEDYIEFLSRMTTNSAIPSIFYPHFRDKSFLFLGYSLRDWNLRVVLRNLGKLLDPKRNASLEEDVVPSWAMQYRPSELERRLWQTRHVNIFDITVDEFVERLEEVRDGR